MKTARQTARELALLSLSQLPSNPERLETHDLQDVILAAVRALAGEVQDTLEMAAAELQRGNDRLLSSQIRAADLPTGRTMVYEAIELAQTAINRLGTAIEIPETIHLSNQKDVRSYTIEIVKSVKTHLAEIDQVLREALVDWQLERLSRIDRDILRIATAEIMFLGIPDKIGTNEAVELAKRYSGEEGYRFINGVLRRVVDKIKVENLNN